MEFRFPVRERSGNWFCPSGGSCIHGKPDDQHNLQLDTANLGNAVAKSRTSLVAAVASVAQARAAITEAWAALD